MAHPELGGRSRLGKSAVRLLLLTAIGCTKAAGSGNAMTAGGTGGEAGTGNAANSGGKASLAGGAGAGGAGASTSRGGAAGAGGGNSNAGHSGSSGTDGAGASGGSPGSGGSAGASGSATAGAPNVPGTFSTNFDLTEAPISENKAWKTGLDPLQSSVSTAGGIAFGTQTGQEFAVKNFNDSQAFLAGTFAANQRGAAVIHKAPGLSGGYTEVEILLRWSVGPLRTGLTYGDTYSYGYEINLAWDGQYINIARFKEPAIFDSLASGSPITQLGVQDGDILSAEIVGNKITAKLTRGGTTTVLGSATDNSGAPFATGTPGIGFYRGTNGGSVTTPTLFAFTSFSATPL